jgi:hypothetical protein
MQASIFPMVGKNRFRFSNRWNFSASVFPIVGKRTGLFSNRWKMSTTGIYTPKTRFELLRNTFYSHFVLCTLAGLFVLDVITPNQYRERAFHDNSMIDAFILAVIAAVCVGCMVWLLHWIADWRYRRKYSKPRYLPQKKQRRHYSLLVGMFCGGMDVIFFLFAWGVFALTIITVIIVIVHIRRFLRTVIRALRPDRYPTWADVLQLLHVYATVLAAFTLITISLSVIHYYYPGETAAFNYAEEPHSIIDAFYFCVVVMTSLGFGDIVPVTLDAKLFVSIECLVSYFMLGLLIGVITRGIAPIHDEAGHCERHPHSQP